MTILSSIIAICIYQSTKKKSNEQLITNDPVFAVAEVTNWTINAKSNGVIITYAFKENSSTYFGEASYTPLMAIKDKPINAHFPVIYSKTDPGVSSLLVIETDFKKFDKEQPDSLKKYNTLFK